MRIVYVGALVALSALGLGEYFDNPLPWLAVNLLVAACAGYFVGRAVEVESAQRDQAAGEEFEYRDLVSPVFKRLAGEMFGIFGLAGMVGLSGFLPGFNAENLFALAMIGLMGLVCVLGACYLSLFLCTRLRDRGVSAGVAGGLVAGLIMEAVLFVGVVGADRLRLLAIAILPLLFLFLLTTRGLAKRPHPVRAGKSMALTLVSIPLLLMFLGMAPFILAPPRGGQLTACKSNLKNLGTAMEMYSTDWSGKYPEDLAMLTPNYLKTIPDCPAAGSATYTLQTGVEAPKNTGGFIDYYILQCEGNFHSAVGVPPNFPQYNGIEGLLEW